MEEENYVQEVASRLEELLPGLPEVLLDMYVLLVFATGEDTTLEAVHDAWSTWKNRLDPKHRSLIPFEMLAPETQQLDAKYRDAIVQAAIELHFRRREGLL